jgi:hypothetical protein
VQPKPHPFRTDGTTVPLNSKTKSIHVRQEEEEQEEEARGKDRRGEPKLKGCSSTISRLKGKREKDAA